MPEPTPTEEARGIQAREWAMLAVDKAAEATTAATKARWWTVLASIAALASIWVQVIR